MKKPQPPMSVRVPLVMSEAEAARVDDWRHERRIWSRSEAIRQLVKESLDRHERRKGRKP